VRKEEERRGGCVGRVSKGLEGLSRTTALHARLGEGKEGGEEGPEVRWAMPQDSTEKGKCKNGRGEREGGKAVERIITYLFRAAF